MRKVTDDYTPEKAHDELIAFFHPHSDAVDVINSLTRTESCVLAALLLDSKSLTTSGYTIPADCCVNRASAVVHSLEKKHFFPISSRKVETESDVGNKTQQSLFFITKEDQARLKDDPLTVFNQCHENAVAKKESQAQRDLRRLVREYGEEGVFNMIKRVANDAEDSDKNVG